MSAPTPTTPDLRLSPDSKRIAWRFSDGGWGWRDINGPYFSAIAMPEEVADWTPLVPALAAVDRDAAVADEAAAHHLAAVILADLDEQHDPERPTHPERVAGYEAGIRRAAELVCESNCIAHTAPAVDEDQVQRMAAAMAESYNERLATSHKDMSTASEWLDEAHAAIAALREVPPVSVEARVVAAIRAEMDPASAWASATVEDLRAAVAAELASGFPHQLRRLVLAACRVLGVVAENPGPTAEFQRLGRVINRALHEVPRVGA